METPKLTELAKLLVSPERFSKLASGLGQLVLEYPDLPETHLEYRARRT